MRKECSDPSHWRKWMLSWFWLQKKSFYGHQQDYQPAAHPHFRVIFWVPQDIHLAKCHQVPRWQEHHWRYSENTRGGVSGVITTYWAKSPSGLIQETCDVSNLRQETLALGFFLVIEKNVFPFSVKWERVETMVSELPSSSQGIQWVLPAYPELDVSSLNFPGWNCQSRKLTYVYVCSVPVLL